MNTLNLATKNTTDFTVLPTGEAYISFRKATDLTGIARSTLQIGTVNSDTSQGLTADMLQESVQRFAFKGNEIAQESYVLIGHH